MHLTSAWRRAQSLLIALMVVIAACAEISGGTTTEAGTAVSTMPAKTTGAPDGEEVPEPLTDPPEGVVELWDALESTLDTSSWNPLEVFPPPDQCHPGRDPHQNRDQVFLRQIKAVTHHIICFLLIGRFQDRDQRKFSKETGILFIL